MTILNDTKNTANHAVHTAARVLEDANHGVEHAVANARQGSERAYTSTLSMVTSGLSSIAGVLSGIRALRGSDALGWVGLARKRSYAESFGMFSAGFAAGAGAALLFAPMTGEQFRRTLWSRMKGIVPMEQKVANAVQDEISQVAGVVQSNIADGLNAVGEAAKHASDGAKHAAGDAVKHAGDAVKHAGDAVKHAGDAVRPNTPMPHRN